jgi:hypothetical protein
LEGDLGRPGSLALALRMKISNGGEFRSLPAKKQPSTRTTTTTRTMGDDALAQQ